MDGDCVGLVIDEDGDVLRRVLTLTGWTTGGRDFVACPTVETTE